MFKHLYLIRGLPGSGKTTFAKDLYMLFRSMDLPVDCIAADDYFTNVDGTYQFNIHEISDAHDWCQNCTNLNMKAGRVVIVHNTFTTEKELVPYLEMAKKYDYKVTSLVVENRHGNKNIHNVPEQTLERMKARFTFKLI